MSEPIEFPHNAWLNAQARAIYESICIIDMRNQEIRDDIKKAMYFGLDALPQAEELMSNLRRRQYFAGQMEGVFNEASLRRINTSRITRYLKVVRSSGRRRRSS